MRKVSDNVYAEFYFWGCNPGFLVTSDGVVMIDTPQQPIDAVRWRERIMEISEGKLIRYLINTEPHTDHISGNAYFPGVEVIGHTGLKERYEESVPMLTSAERTERMKESDPDSVWLLEHPSYPPNPPTQTFSEDFTLQLGSHRIQIMHIPGHTAPQTAVFLPEEGVLFTGDNIFNSCKTFIQEADPWEWLEALERIGRIDARVIVPGHGEPCDRTYLPEQARILEAWIAAVEEMVDRGLTEEEALKQPAPAVDPYPIGQHLFALSAWVDSRNVSNLYRRITARRQAKTKTKAKAKSG